jgi:hypothetical protein
MNPALIDIDQIDQLDAGGHATPEDGMCLLEVRFWAKVDKSGDCWEWTGTRTRQGYGGFRVGDRTVKAHRFAWSVIASRGAIPAGLVVMHLCDNPPCVRPEHLRLGTVADNNRDREAKRGRSPNLNAGPAALRARTHCPQGHEYSGANVRYRPDGRRRCAECYRLREALRRERDRAAINARRRAARRGTR